MAMTLTKDVPFNMPMTWLPAGGKTKRMACGNTIRKNDLAGVKPKDLAASN